MIRSPNECDSNADTCCLGPNFLITNYTRRTADVYAYDSNIEPVRGVPIVQGATAYDDPRTGITYLLIINEGLYYGTKLDHTLVNPNQIRHYGINFRDNPYDPMRDLSIEVNDELTIPLNTSGTKVQFVSRTPTQEELETCPRVVLTSPSEWNPKDIRLGELKSDQPDHRNINEVITDQDGNYLYLDINDDTALLHSIEPSLVRLSQLLTKRVVASINEDMLDVQKHRTHVSTD